MPPSHGLTVPRQSVGNECLMFHGAPAEAVDQICRTGFDRRLAGSKHGAVRSLSPSTSIEPESLVDETSAIAGQRASRNVWVRDGSAAQFRHALAAKHLSSLKL